MSHSKNLQQQVEQQKKVIQYLRQKFTETIGHEPELPQTWSEFLNVEDQFAPILEEENQNEKKQYEVEKKSQEENFLQAIINLNLPHRIPPQVDKKGGIQKKNLMSTNFDPANPFHMIEIINLSNFANRNFNKSAFKELLDSIQDMRFLHCIVIQNNGIDDTYQEEIEQLFKNKQIRQIDLSRNNIGKKGGNAIAKILKEQVQHIEWIDLSGNCFGTDQNTIVALCNGIKSQPDLYHFCLDVNLLSNNPHEKFTLVEQVAKLTQQCPNLNSLGLIYSKVTGAAMKIIEQSLYNGQIHLTGLNFKFSFLDLECIYILRRILERNKTLIKLDLSGNALTALAGIAIVKALSQNIILCDLNLSKNNLEDNFAIVLAETLKINQTLHTCQIHNNPIGKEGAQQLLQVLHEDNDTIQSLGEINASNTNMGVLNITLLQKALKINSVTKEAKSKIIKNQWNNQGEDPKDINQKQMNNYSTFQVQYDQEYDNYTLIKPILFTNEPYADFNKFELWNI